MIGCSDIKTKINYKKIKDPSARRIPYSLNIHFICDFKVPFSENDRLEGHVGSLGKVLVTWESSLVLRI